MTQNIYENANQPQHNNSFVSVQELEMKCLQQMQENGISFQGPLNTNGEIHRFSIDSKKLQPDEWYIAYQGTHQNGNPYLCCTYGTWSGGQHKHYYKSYRNENGITQEEFNYLRNEEKRRQQEFEEKIKKEKEERIAQANKAWDIAKTLSQSKNHIAYLLDRVERQITSVLTKGIIPIFEADKGYDAETLRDKLLWCRIFPWICRRKKPGKAAEKVEALLKRIRWKVERADSWLQRKFRRLTVRWERRTRYWKGFLTFSLITFWMDKLVR